MFKFLFILGVTFVGLAPAQDVGPDPEVTIPHFGNATCPFTKKPVNPKKSVKVGAERVWVCSSSCLMKADKDPKAALAKAYPAAKTVDLKNARCPIMGHATKSSVSMTFQGYRIRLCCKGCDEKLLRDPTRHLALLTNKGMKAMDNPYCPIMESSKVKKGKYIAYKNWLIGICCPGCDRGFSADPDRFLKELLVDRKNRRKNKKG